MNEFEIVVLNEPSVFEPLKFYCTCSDRAEEFLNLAHWSVMKKWNEYDRKYRKLCDFYEYKFVE